MIEMNAMVYYACSYPLASGSIVCRGNWGRILRLEAIGPSTFEILLREVVFEKVRLQHYPTRPSRFDCNFVCPNRNSMEEFIKATYPNRRFDLIYEVEPVDPNAPRFETDWSLVRALQNLSLDQAEDLAHQYWQGTSTKNVNPQNLEVLFASDIRILRRV